jgi:A/G-specific adenine glycosylase
MLQQTQVATVIPYFEKFMTRFPSVQDLANADQDEVLHHWTGLGYYARARNLHKTAKAVVEEYSGNFPSDPEKLEQLSGIGRSTAAAIASSVFDTHAAILDGNVKRVLARFTALDEWTGTTESQKTLWEMATELTPAKRVADYNQVMMDLGAIVCTRSKPNCDQCPLKKNCLAKQQNRVKELPISKPKKEKPTRDTVFLIEQKSDGTVYLEQRPSSGIWGGLYSFPEFDNEEALVEHLEQRGLNTDTLNRLSTFKHTFSHYHLNITPVVLPVQKAKNIVNEKASLWFNPLLSLSEEQAIGLPTPVTKLLALIARAM